ncbi:MAG: Uma2 family endonuclease [Pyrinomonadaceae bacterium]|nr:Uma2 family endonuclease [Pyrinomonadaceae bacterium]
MATVIETTKTTPIPPFSSVSAKNGKGKPRSEASINRFLMKHKDYEYINGKLEKKIMPNAKHSGVATRLSAEIWFYLKENKIGRVYSEAHFQIGEDKRIPDVAFVSAEKIPVEGEPQKFWEFAPDLAIEVVSPTDFYQDVTEKIEDYFAAGVTQVWILNPEIEKLSVYFSPTKVKIYSKNEILKTEEILPNFRLNLSDIFID